MVVKNCLLRVQNVLHLNKNLPVRLFNNQPTRLSYQVKLKKKIFGYVRMPIHSAEFFPPKLEIGDTCLKRFVFERSL